MTDQLTPLKVDLTGIRVGQFVKFLDRHYLVSRLDLTERLDSLGHVNTELELHLELQEGAFPKVLELPSVSDRTVRLNGMTWGVCVHDLYNSQVRLGLVRIYDPKSDSGAP